MDLINTHFPNPKKKERPYRPALVGPYKHPFVGPYNHPPCNQKEFGRMFHILIYEKKNLRKTLGNEELMFSNM